MGLGRKILETVFGSEETRKADKRELALMNKAERRKGLTAAEQKEFEALHQISRRRFLIRMGLLGAGGALGDSCSSRFNSKRS